MRLYVPIILTLFLLSCQQEKTPRLVENTGYAQGTTYQIKYLTQPNRNYAVEIDQIFNDIDQSMSTYDSTSLISKVNKGETFVPVDSMFLAVLHRSLQIAEETGGDFDPTIGPLTQLWGFGFDEVRTDVTIQQIEEIKSRTGYEKIELRENKVRIPEGSSLDFNAIAQGFTVDVIADFLDEKGIKNYMVEVGGEVRANGFNENGNVWKIGVDKPQEEIDTDDRFQFIIELENAALVTSGNYRKFWIDEETGTKYAHTIDPHTGRPARNRLLSATVLAASAMDADAYATVCMVRGLEGCKELLAEKENLEGYLVFSSESGEWEVFVSEGFHPYIVD